MPALIDTPTLKLYLFPRDADEMERAITQAVSMYGDGTTPPRITAEIDDPLLEEVLDLTCTLVPSGVQVLVQGRKKFLSSRCTMPWGFNFTRFGYQVGRMAEQVNRKERGKH